MERELFVFVDLESNAVPVGRLWTRVRSGRETATFEYDAAWLKHPHAFALGPSLPLTTGSFFSEKSLFGPFTDPAPDRWGEKLMRHNERERAAKAGTQPRTLMAADFLMGVEDETRNGAMRFRAKPDGPFLAQSGSPVPPLLELKNLLSATDRIEKDRARKSDLALVLAPGGSLGGARPKTSVRDRARRLHIAKFPWVKDEWPVILWEATALELAEGAGIATPRFKIEMAGQKPVLLTARFDRGEAGMRIPYMSAMTALDAKDHDESRSYLELVDVLRQTGGAPNIDIQQLWRRMVFNVLISNTDDHLRNHAFLWAPGGWRLSPAYDLNPCPLDVGGRIHVLALNEVETSASLEIALSVASYFGLKKGEATQIAGEVASAVLRWRQVASSNKITKAQIERMASAFDHKDLAKAKTYATVVATPAVAKKVTPAKPPARKGRGAAKKKTGAAPRSKRRA